jgi:hypothetical protein
MITGEASDKSEKYYTDGDHYHGGNGKTAVIDIRIPSPYGVMEDLSRVIPNPFLTHFVRKFRRRVDGFAKSAITIRKDVSNPELYWSGSCEDLTGYVFVERTYDGGRRK